MVGISGYKDEQRRFDLHHPLHNRKAVKAGHLDVQKHQIGLVRLDFADRFPAILAGVDYLYIIMGFEPQLQPLNGQFFIINQYGANGHAVAILSCLFAGGAGATAGVVSTLYGNSMTT